ncbi:serine hydrolase [Devosia sp. ZB163]|uniref:serine hydrolase domain-containing protein n=1 Tax=Devosia sp. ZB163 TaxID=3025938 RepID=UPI0023608F58|nr:serine hydrolase [Devosia sp. ZB163]MDC9825320.1 serine hydrolase [Devosia sp. ZB163]
MADPELQKRFDAAYAPLEQAIDSGRVPGGVLGIIDLKHGRIVDAKGSAWVVPERRPMTVDTWFDLASLTKVLFTTPRILALHAAGRLDLDAPLTSVIPDFRQFTPEAWERKVTFRQCLGHQTAFPNDVAIFTYGENPRLLRNFVLQHRWEAVPSIYTCVNFILLGIALERLEGRMIREMDPGPGFAFSAAPEQAAATEFCTWRDRIVVGEVHDENCAALQGAGNAGLFGTVHSVLDAAEALLRGDAAGDPLVKLQRAPLGATRTHGWERPYVGWTGGDVANASTIGHTGFTGTGLWIDFDNQRAWTLLTNRVHPSRYSDSGILQLRRAVGDAVNA